MTVYADLYFLLNGAVDLVLLAVAGRLAGGRAPVWRLLCAATAGGLYAAVELWAPGSPAFGVPGRVLASVVLVLIAYAPAPPARLLATFAYLYLGAVFVAGVVLAVTLASAPAAAGAASASSLYPRFIPWWAVAAGLLAVLLGGRVWRGRRAARRGRLIGVHVAVGSAAATCLGLVDSGNRLVDPVGSEPVVVVDPVALGPLLPPAMAASLGDLAAVARAADSVGWGMRLRLIPYRALGTGNGLLVGFRPDRVDLAGRGTEDVTVGLAPGPLDPSGQYQALVPSCLVRESA